MSDEDEYGDALKNAALAYCTKPEFRSRWRWQDPSGEEASHVLWLFAKEGYGAGGFTASLIELMCRSDPGNLARLALGFPGYASAVYAAKQDDDGLDRLRSCGQTAR